MNNPSADPAPGGATAKRGVGARQRTLIICVALLAVITAGVWQINYDDRPPSGAFRAVNDPDDITLPLDAYRLTRTQSGRVETARRLLTARCAARFGVTFTDD